MKIDTRIRYSKIHHKSHVHIYLDKEDEEWFSRCKTYYGTLSECEIFKQHHDIYSIIHKLFTTKAILYVHVKRYKKEKVNQLFELERQVKENNIE